MRARTRNDNTRRHTRIDNTRLLLGVILAALGLAICGGVVNVLIQGGHHAQNAEHTERE